MEFVMKATEEFPRCWEIRDCSPLLYLNCFAFKQRDVPCWNISDTQCSIVSGTPKTCDLCEVFVIWQRRVNRSEMSSPEED
jgi:hypothetical protein